MSAPVLPRPTNLRSRDQRTDLDQRLDRRRTGVAVAREYPVGRVFTVKNHTLGDAVGKLSSPVSKTIGDFVNAFVKRDRDVEPFIREHPLMLRNPDRHVEIVPRHRGEYNLFQFEDSVR